MCDPNQTPDFQYGLSDNLNTTPSGWNLSALLESKSKHSDQPENPENQVASQADQEAKMRTDFQLDPHFDRDDSPTRRDLSAY